MVPAASGSATTAPAVFHSDHVGAGPALPKGGSPRTRLSTPPNPCSPWRLDGIVHTRQCLHYCLHKCSVGTLGLIFRSNPPSLVKKRPASPIPPASPQRPAPALQPRCDTPQTARTHACARKP